MTSPLGPLLTFLGFRGSFRPSALKEFTTLALESPLCLTRRSLTSRSSCFDCNFCWTIDRLSQTVISRIALTVSEQRHPFAFFAFVHSAAICIGTSIELALTLCPESFAYGSLSLVVTRPSICSLPVSLYCQICLTLWTSQAECPAAEFWTGNLSVVSLLLSGQEFCCVRLFHRFWLTFSQRIFVPTCYRSLAFSSVFSLSVAFLRSPEASF